MRGLTFALLTISAATAAFGQGWEFGAVGGVGLLNGVSVTSPAGSATAGFAKGFVAGAFLGQDLNRHFAGEIHYEYMQSDLRLSAGGQAAQFSGAAHAIHYDVVIHSNRSESRTQFFGILGGGAKGFAGTGTEEAVQPLSQYGYFTRTTTFKPMVTAGAGIAYALSAKLSLRAEVRDFVTPFPTAVLTPPAGVKYGNWLQEIVPMLSVVYR